MVVHKRSSHTFGNALARSAAGPQRVWELLADGRRWPEWSASVEWAVVAMMMVRRVEGSTAR